MTAKEVFKIAELSNNPQGAIRYLYGKKEPTVGEIKALTGENINEMTNEELRTAVSKATRVSKQRLANLEGKYSPAKAILEGETLPTEKQIKEMSQSELRHILKKENRFLNAKTSTISGEKERIRNFVRLSVDTEGKTQRQIEIEITKKINKMGGYWALGEVFELIDEIESLDPSAVYEMGSGEFIGWVVENYAMGFDDPVKLAEKLRERITELQNKDEEMLAEFGW